MFSHPKSIVCRIIPVFMFISMAILFLAASDACAFSRPERGIGGPHWRSHGKGPSRRPPGHKPKVVRERHSRHDRFSHRTPRLGFPFLPPPPPPIGALFSRLPFGHITIGLGHRTHYYCDGVYYRRVPRGYVVVKEPPEVVVVRETRSPTEILPETGDRVLVTAPKLNVRSGPGKEFDVVDLIRRGEPLEVHGHATGWYYVALPSGEFGWVMSRYTTPSPEDADG